MHDMPAHTPASNHQHFYIIQSLIFRFPWPLQHSAQLQNNIAFIIRNFSPVGSVFFPIQIRRRGGQVDAVTKKKSTTPPSLHRQGTEMYSITVIIQLVFQHHRPLNRVCVRKERLCGSFTLTLKPIARWCIEDCLQKVGKRPRYRAEMIVGTEKRHFAPAKNNGKDAGTYSYLAALWCEFSILVILFFCHFIKLILRLEE